MEAKPRILYLDFPSQYLLTSTLLRFEEHYESPEFAGKVFTLEEYMDWYAAQDAEFTYHRGWKRPRREALKDAKRSGNFTYFLDWSGFNIPSHAFKAFKEGQFNPLSRKEAAVLQLLAKVPEPYYLIATYGGDTGTLAHEVVHGLFYCDPAYRTKVSLLVQRRSAMAAPMAEWLTGVGYGSNVHADETNAYCCTGWSNSMDAKLIEQMEPLAVQLRGVFRNHFGFEPNDKANAERLNEFVTTLPFEKFKALVAP